MEKKYKKLATDTILFGISSFGSKILVFLLLPLYTNILSTADYGTYDLINNIVLLIYPILTLGIIESIIRISYDQGVEKNEILSNCLFILGIGAAILLCVAPFLGCFSDTLKLYWPYLCLFYISYVLYLCLSYYCKAKNMIKFFAIQGIVNTALTISLNLLFLLVFKLGLKGYFLATILSYFLTSIFIIIFGKVYKDIFHYRLNFKLLKNMLKFSLPLIPTLVAWWINTSIDKYFIIYYSGIEASGIYSVAHKIPSILTVVVTIFNSAWELSTIQSYNDEDKSEFYSNIYKYFFICCSFVCLILIIFSKIIGRVLFASDYFVAWKYIAVLLVSSLFSSLSGFTASIFRSYKKTVNLMVSVIVGAAVNIILNYFFIKQFDVMGAAYATMISFFVVWLIREICLHKLIKIKIPIVKWSIAMILITVSAILFGNDFKYKYAVCGLVFLIYFIIFFKDIKRIVIKVVKGLKEKTRPTKETIVNDDTAIDQNIVDKE